MSKFGTITEVAAALAATVGTKAQPAWNGSVFVFKTKLANGDEVIVNVTPASKRIQRR